MSEKLFHKKKIRKANELARRKAKKSPYQTVRIICEDTKSSRLYLQQLVKHFRLNTVNIEVIASKGSAPISVVENGIEIAKNNEGIDIIACVFDRDDHQSFHQALNKTNNHKPKSSDKSQALLKSFASTPCYEIWLLLHFVFSSKPYTRSGSKSAADNLLADLIIHLPKYNKSNLCWFDEIIQKIDTAIKNAKKLKKYNKENSCDNPDTNLHELIELLQSLKK